MGLLDFIKKLPTLNEIKGSYGELLVKYYSKAMYDSLVLHDILINGADGHTSQIDLIIINSKGIYVVEVKNYENARIYGDGKKSKWYYYLGGKKYDIYSPLRQNQKHIEYLKTFLSHFGDIQFFSIITMLCEDFKITNIDPNPENRTSVICNSLPSMDRGFDLIAKGKPDILNKEKRQQIYDFIINNQFSGKEARKEHKENVKAYKNNDNQQKTCPYCKTELVLRKGKFGEFYGCSNFPKCRYTLKK